MAVERAQLLALAAEPFDLAEVTFPTVNRLGCVRVQANAYSVPLPAGTAVQARLAADALEVWHAGQCVARHERSSGRHQEVLDLDHYLDEFVFRFNRRHARSVGLLFYRLAQYAADSAPHPYPTIVGGSLVRHA